MHSSYLAAFLTFTAFIFVTELFDTDLPSGRRLHLSLAPALGFAMLEAALNGTHAVPVATGTFVCAAGLASLVRKLTKRDVRIRDLTVAVVAIAGSTAAYAMARDIGPVKVLHDGPHNSGLPYSASIVGLVLVLGIALVTEPLSRLFALSENRRVDAFVRSFMSEASLQAAVVSVAALVALAFPKLGAWSFPLFLGPLAATRYAFRQIATIRTTEVQTLRALSKIPEMAGYTAPGHSRRVAELCVAIAGDLGVDELQRREIEYAALLHDIGRVVLDDTDLDHASAHLKQSVAQTGANIVAAAGTFPRVADMIREQNEPYRRRGEVLNSKIPLGARILKVANSYDDLLNPPEGKNESVDALERLHMGKAYDYDPDVIASLVRVLERETPSYELSSR